MTAFNKLLGFSRTLVVVGHLDNSLEIIQMPPMSTHRRCVLVLLQVVVTVMRRPAPFLWMARQVTKSPTHRALHRVLEECGHMSAKFRLGVGDNGSFLTVSVLSFLLTLSMMRSPPLQSFRRRLMIPNDGLDSSRREFLDITMFKKTNFSVSSGDLRGNMEALRISSSGGASIGM